MPKVYKISSAAHEDAIKKLHNNTVPLPLAYDPLPTQAAQNLAAVSSIAPSTAQREIPPLRPQLKLPAPEYLHFDPALQDAMQEITRDYAALQNSTQIALETVADLEETVNAVATVDLTEPERVNYLLLILDLHNTVEELSMKHLDYISKAIRRDSEELDRLNLKKTEELQKYAEKIKDGETWSFFRSIAEYFGYALSLVTGAALIATGVGAVAGSFLIAAGGLGLANRIMNDTNAWQSIVAYFTKSREMQDNIAQWISGSLSVISLGLGLIGGVAAIQSGGLRLIDAALGTEKAIEKLGVVAAVAGAGFRVGESWTIKETKNTEAVLKVIEGKLFMMQQTLKQTSSEAKKTIETMQILTKQTKEAISAFG